MFVTYRRSLVRTVTALSRLSNAGGTGFWYRSLAQGVAGDKDEDTSMMKTTKTTLLSDPCLVENTTKSKIARIQASEKLALLQEKKKAFEKSLLEVESELLTAEYEDRSCKLLCRNQDMIEVALPRIASTAFSYENVCSECISYILPNQAYFRNPQNEVDSHKLVTDILKTLHRGEIFELDTDEWAKGKYERRREVDVVRWSKNRDGYFRKFNFHSLREDLTKAKLSAMIAASLGVKVAEQIDTICGMKLCYDVVPAHDHFEKKTVLSFYDLEEKTTPAVGQEKD